jgi:NADPH2:quinone reductase
MTIHMRHTAATRPIPDTPASSRATRHHGRKISTPEYADKIKRLINGATQSCSVDQGLVTALVRNVSASCDLLRRLGAAQVVEQVADEFDFILDGVGGAVFGLAIEHVARHGIVVNIGTLHDEEMVAFRAADFDRAYGARIYTLNLPDELASHGSATTDLSRLRRLIVDGRLDGQVEIEGTWREPASAIGALLNRRMGGKAVLHVD